MPVIVVGADTASGRAILNRLQSPERDVRAFVSDARIGHEFKKEGLKVALGDVSDESHVEAAALGCFTAVLVAEAALDRRERSFADSSHEVLEGWERAMESAGVSRNIWVSAALRPPSQTIESATVDPNDPDLIERVVALDEAQEIGDTPDI